MLRADDEGGLDALAARLREALPAASWESDPVVCGLKPDERVARAVQDALRALGRELIDNPAPLPFATDFGNVSQRVPAALIGIGRAGGWAFHTDEGAAQFAADGIDAALTMARVLALVVIRLTGDDTSTSS